MFRFPRRAIAVPLIETEAALLPWLSTRLTLAVPRPIYVGTPSTRYRWPFAGYPLLAGQTVAAAQPTLDDRRAMAVALAQFLAALHATPADEARRRGAGPDTLDRLNAEARRRATDERLNDIIGRGLHCDRRAIDRILTRSDGHAPALARHGIRWRSSPMQRRPPTTT